MASSARKAFWLLKSFNHVGTVITMIETYSHANDECYANLLDILEQLFLVLYYFYENLVFMARTKLVGFTEDMIDDWGNWSWFVGDFVCFAAAVMRMYISHRNLSRHVALLPSDNCLMISRYINGGRQKLPHRSSNDTGCRHKHCGGTQEEIFRLASIRDNRKSHHYPQVYVHVDDNWFTRFSN
jgi:hypothetical protein